MSAPDPKAWAMRFEELCEIASDDDAIAEKVVANIARRRALAELKALAGRTCNFCLAHQGTGLFPYVVGRGHPNHSGGGYFVCTDSDIQDRIAAIEAEEA